VKSRRGMFALLVVLALLLLAAFAVPALAGTDLNSYEQQLVKCVNQERAKKDLAKLKVQAALVEAARAHSADMGENKYLEHDSLDGSSFADRIMQFGYDRDGYSMWKAGEDIAWGAGLYSSPVLIVDEWMASPAHRAVILNKSLREIGVGAVSTEGYDAVEGTVWFFTLDAGVRAK
jgi:uncharacterized protein YkwD